MDTSHPRNDAASVDLVRVHRGDLVESVHRGSLVVLEGDTPLISAGTTDLPVFYRSTAKPLQALVLLTSGAAARFGLEDEELAIAAGSHNASPRHLDVVRSLLSKARVEESALRCGGHWSIDKKIARAQAAARGGDLAPLPAIWSNCSGKHASMLAAARAMEAETDGYLDESHPVQREITRLIAAFAGVEPGEIPLGLDGCGAPVHAVSLEAMARSMVRLGRPQGGAHAEAARRMGAAMSAHPDLIAGEGRFDTDLMETASVRILSKGGAEGVHGISVPERGLGIAVKVDDGKDRGYRQLLIELLRRYDVLTDAEADALAERHGRTLRNFAGDEVGRLEVALRA